MSNVLVMRNRRHYRSAGTGTQGAPGEGDAAPPEPMPRRNKAKAVPSILKWAALTAGGAIVGAIAVRRFEEYRRSKDQPEALPEATPQQPAALPAATMPQVQQPPIVVPMPYPMMQPAYGPPAGFGAPVPAPTAPAAPAQQSASDRFEEEIERLEQLQERTRKARQARIQRIMREFEEDL